jgi:hypothetical protein
MILLLATGVCSSAKIASPRRETGHGGGKSATRELKWSFRTSELKLAKEIL